MINLLPPELKESYRYAQRNVMLSRWVFACLLALLGLGALSTGGAIYVHQTTQTYVARAADQQRVLTEQDQAATQNEVNNITSSLKLAVQVLSKEVLFSKLLTQLAAIVPSNAVLTDTTIATASNSVNISALTTDYAAAAQLQVNLADPSNKLFKQADITAISCSAVVTRYPCTVTIRALFTSSNPFLFINDGMTK